MPRPRVHGFESYEGLPLDHPQRRKIQNRNAQRTFRRKRAASNQQEQTPSEENSDKPTDTSLKLPDLPSSDEMNLNQVQTSGDASSTYQVTTSGPHVDIPFSPPASNFDGFLDPIDLDNHAGPEPDRGALAAPDGDTSFDHLIEWQPSTPSGHPVEKSTGSSTSNNPPAHPKSLSSETRFPTVSGMEHSHSRARLDVLDSHYPSNNLNGLTGATVKSSALNRNEQEHHHRLSGLANLHFLQGLLRDNQGRFNQHASLDGNFLPRQNTISDAFSRPYANIQARSSDGNSPLFSSKGSSEPTTLGGGSSNGSSEDDGTADSNVTNTRGSRLWRHLIHTCCEVGHESMVEEIIQAGIDIDKRDSAGNTPLHIAAGAGHEQVMAYLINRGCDVNAMNNAGWTAAHLASAKGHRRCLRLLLELNVSPWAMLDVPR
ncbi:hypothetical protein FQN54_005096 [Arachnomyces sp. PD_36]|nr:hypothetical protein FQN54_005096 [Arachnomyces sp. PD_36]